MKTNKTRTILLIAITLLVLATMVNGCATRSATDPTSASAEQS